MRSKFRKVNKALGKLLAAHPFYGSMAVKLPIEEADGRVATIGCDGEAIFVDSEWLMRADPYDVMVSLAHLVTACALKHHLRREDRHYGFWQEASRAVTNHILQDSGVLALTPQWNKYAGRVSNNSVEQIYNKIVQERQEEADEEERERRENEKGDEEDDNYDEDDDYDDEDEEDDDDDEDDDWDDDDNEKEEQKVSGASVLETKPELPQNAKKGVFGEVMDAPTDGGEHDKKNKALDWDIAAREAQRLCNMRGDEIPSAVEEAVLDGKGPERDWEELLREFMFNISKDDYSWVNPNKRFAWQDVFLPGKRGEGMGEIAMVLDTSGSISREELQMFWTGIKNIVEELLPEKIVIYSCDTEVRKVEEYDPGNLPDELEVSGRGGTYFRPAFEAIANSGADPAVILYWTDLDVHNNEWGDEPASPVIWLQSRQAQYYGMKPEVPFGRVIPVYKENR